MSRPLSHFLPAACVVLSLGFTACVGTIYDPMYSNRKTHYKPLAAKKDVSAEEVLGAVDSRRQSGEMPTDSALLPPPASSDIPGLTPAPAPEGGAMMPPPLPPAN